MSSATQGDVLMCESCDLGQAQSRLQGHQQQRMIPASVPRVFVRHTQQRFDFGSRQEVNKPPVKALGWRCEDALDLRAMGRHLVRGKVKERAYGGQSKIARARADAPLRFKLVQKGGDERRIDFFKCRVIRRDMQPLVREAQQESEGVAIRCAR